MKYLAVQGVFERVGPGVYRHNTVSEMLKNEHLNGSRSAGIQFIRVLAMKARPAQSEAKSAFSSRKCSIAWLCVSRESE